MSKNNTVEGTKDNKKSASKKSTAKKAEAKKTSKKSDSKKSAAKSTTEKKSGFNIKQLGGALFAKMMRGGASELRANAEEVLSLLLRAQKEFGQTLVMVTHDMTIARRADRVLKMDDGFLSRMLPEELQ